MKNLIESRTISESNERIILSACLLGEETYYKILQKVAPEHFKVRHNHAVFQAYKRVSENGTPLDPHNIEPELTNDLNALKTYQEICKQPADESQINAAISVLIDRKVRRDLERLRTEFTSDLETDDSSSIVLDRISERLLKLNTEKAISTELISEVIEESFPDLPDIKEQKGLLGIPTGIPELDKRTSGLQLGKTSVITGSTSDGKSSLALQMTKNAVSEGYLSAYFTLEDSSNQIINRMLSNETELDSYDVMHRRFDDKNKTKVKKALKMIKTYPLYIDDSAMHTPTSIYNECRRINFKNNDNLKLVVIDYLQSMTEDTQLLQEYTRQIQNYAKLLKAHIILVSQISRAREYHQIEWTQAPSLADSKGSSSIEQSAHTLIAITSPSLREGGDGKEKPAILWVVKAKDAMPGSIYTTFKRYCYKFVPVSRKDNKMSAFFNSNDKKD